jgi:hypothetical protein
MANFVGHVVLGTNCPSDLSTEQLDIPPPHTVGRDFDRGFADTESARDIAVRLLYIVAYEKRPQLLE